MEQRNPLRGPNVTERSKRAGVMSEAGVGWSSELFQDCREMVTRTDAIEVASR